MSGAAGNLRRRGGDERKRGGNPRVHLDVFRGDFEIVSGPGQALYVAFGVNRLPIRIGYSVFNRDRLVTQHAINGTCRGLHR